MDKQIRDSESDNSVMEFDINVEIIPKYTTEEMEDAINKGGEISDVIVSFGLKAAVITYQIEPDYEAFIESVEDLLTEYYGLELFYEHNQNERSKYYSFLAKEKTSGKVYYIFSLCLGISYPPANRTEASQELRIEATDTESDKELKKDISKDRKPYLLIIAVNNKQFDSYEAAFVDMDEKIEKWIEANSHNPIAMQ